MFTAHFPCIFHDWKLLTRFSRFTKMHENAVRIDIGVAFTKWKDLCDRLGQQKGANLTCILLDK